MPRLAVLLAAAVLAGCSLQPTDYNGSGAPREAAIVPLRSDRPVVALALGSGGARGFAHVGVIKALEEGGIEADIVTGASSGAVVAALYASGYRDGRIERIALEVEESDLVDLTPVGKGWVKGEALQDFVNRMVGDRPIEGLPRRFAVVATAATSGRLTVFNPGNTGVAVRASASVPRVFIPPIINGEEYLDGGLLSPVPVKLARAMGADVVIAVDVSWFAQARNAAGTGMSQYGRSGRLRAADRRARSGRRRGHAADGADPPARLRPQDREHPRGRDGGARGARGDPGADRGSRRAQARPPVVIPSPHGTRRVNPRALRARAPVYPLPGAPRPHE